MPSSRTTGSRKTGETQGTRAEQRRRDEHAAEIRDRRNRSGGDAHAPSRMDGLRNWHVNGDALQAGAPHGELIALSHGVHEGRVEVGARDAYIAVHGSVVLPPSRTLRAALPVLRDRALE